VLAVGRSEILLRSWVAPAAITLVAAGALIFDAWTPQVVSVTAGYVGLILVGYWLPGPRASLALALLATPLIIIGHSISIVESTPEWQSWLNRGLSIGTVWLPYSASAPAGTLLRGELSSMPVERHWRI
jgi:hypothetical protein